ADGRVTCWGSDEHGQLGPAATGDRLAPGADTPLRGLAGRALAAGDDPTCALLVGGALKCWGRNAAGQLGLGGTSTRGDQVAELGDALPAVDLGAGATAIAVAAGAAHTCAVLATGEVTCWGAGDAGQLGQGLADGHLAPPPPIPLLTKVTAVA